MDKERLLLVTLMGSFIHDLRNKLSIFNHYLENLEDLAEENSWDTAKKDILGGLKNIEHLDAVMTQYQAAFLSPKHDKNQTKSLSEIAIELQIVFGDLAFKKNIELTVDSNLSGEVTGVFPELQYTWAIIGLRHLMEIERYEDTVKARFCEGSPLKVTLENGTVLFDFKQ
jgi:hypothetical protein